MLAKELGNGKPGFIIGQMENLVLPLHIPDSIKYFMSVGRGEGWGHSIVLYIDLLTG